MNNSEFKNLINKVKQNENQPVIQKVSTVHKDKKEEVQFNFYIEQELLKKIKLLAIEKNLSIKKIIHSSLILYLEKSK